ICMQIQAMQRVRPLIIRQGSYWLNPYACMFGRSRYYLVSVTYLDDMMNNIFLDKRFYLSILSGFCMTTAFAISTPPLIIVSGENVQNMQPGTTQTLTYVVHNNVRVAPVPLNLAPTRTRLMPGTGSSLISWQFNDD